MFLKIPTIVHAADRRNHPVATISTPKRALLALSQRAPQPAIVSRPSGRPIRSRG